MPKQHNPSSGPSVISLYSGAGGMDLGFAKAGFVPIFANDIDPSATATHQKLSSVQDPNWLEAASNLKGCNVTTCDVRELHDMFRTGTADVVIGGPPCQGFSVAGKMDPNDPRSRHVFDFLGIVSKVRPKAFVMENVAALAKNRRWSHILDRLRQQAESDYDTHLVVLNASHWGVPQARERMFLIGMARGCATPDFSAPISKDSPPTVRATLKKLPPVGTAGNNSTCVAKITLAKNPVLRKSPFAGMLFNGQGRPIDLDRPAPTLPASMGGNRTPIIDQNNLEDKNSTPWVTSYHDRLWNKKKAPLRRLPKDANLRRLSVQEAAAIQSFPTDLAWQGSQSAQFRQIGNAVPPILAYHVAKELKRCLG